MAVRLDGGSTKSGYVQALIDGQWIYICYSTDHYDYFYPNWGINDANVICRQLGYDKAGMTWLRYHSDHVELDSVMWYVNCTGNEDNLGQCYFETRTSCSRHYQSNPSASVTCSTVTTGTFDVSHWEKREYNNLSSISRIKKKTHHIPWWLT